MNPKLISKEEFNEIYSKVPRLCVEIIIKSNEGILLTKRAIEPGIGTWHFPGSTVLFGETLKEAVKRTAKDELNLDVEISKLLGTLEFKEKDTVFEHPISLAFLVKIKSGTLKTNWQATEAKYFKKVPENIFPDQGRFLKENLGME